jgi:hypothetical protein
MRFLTLLVVILTTALSVLAQPDLLWTRTFEGPGHASCSGMVLTPDGGSLLAGTIVLQDFARTDFWLVKTNSSGDTLWTRLYGEPLGWDECGAIGTTSDGNFILAGWAQPDTTLWQCYSWFLKVNQQGDIIWSRRYSAGGPVYYQQILETTDGGFLVTSSGFRILKLSADGDSLWSRWYSIGNSGASESVTARQTDDGGYLVAATGHPTGSSSTVRLLKLSAQGDSLWGRDFAQGFNTECGGMQLTADGGCLISGRCNSPEANYPDFWLMRVSAEGDSLWSRFYDPGHMQTRCTTLEPTADGGFVLCGTLDNVVTLWLVKIDADGDSLWSRTVQEAQHISGRLVLHELTDGEFSLAATAGLYGSETYWLTRLGTHSIAESAPLPSSMELLSVYPNPFNPTTTISLSLPHSAPVSLQVFDVLGRSVWRKELGLLAAGEHREVFDGTGLSTGLYFVNVKAGEATRTRKIMLLK